MTRRRPQQLTKEQRRQAARKAAVALRESERRKRRRTWIGAIAAALVVIGGLVAIGLTVGRGGGGPSAAGHNDPTLDHSTAVLADTSRGAKGKTVDGISSAGSEQLAFHVHSHLQLYVNGKQRLVPYGVGIVPPLDVQTANGQSFAGGGKAIYWLHTHDESGIVHIESPVQRTFTLGNFFDIWGRKLGPKQVGPDNGTVTAFVDGKKFSGDPAGIKLGAHKVIQLDVGKVVPPQPYTFPQGV